MVTGAFAITAAALLERRKAGTAPMAALTVDGGFDIKADPDFIAPEEGAAPAGITTTAQAYSKFPAGTEVRDIMSGKTLTIVEPLETADYGPFVFYKDEAGETHPIRADQLEVVPGAAAAGLPAAPPPDAADLGTHSGEDLPAAAAGIAPASLTPPQKPTNPSAADLKVQADAYRAKLRAKADLIAASKGITDDSVVTASADSRKITFGALKAHVLASAKAKQAGCPAAAQLIGYIPKNWDALMAGMKRDGLLVTIASPYSPTMVADLAKKGMTDEEILFEACQHGTNGIMAKVMAALKVLHGGAPVAPPAEGTPGTPAQGSGASEVPAGGPAKAPAAPGGTATLPAAAVQAPAMTAAAVPTGPAPVPASGNVAVWDETMEGGKGGWKEVKATLANRFLKASQTLLFAIHANLKANPEFVNIEPNWDNMVKGLHRQNDIAFWTKNLQGTDDTSAWFAAVAADHPNAKIAEMGKAAPSYRAGATYAGQSKPTGAPAPHGQPEVKGSKVKAGLHRLPGGKWADTNGNSYATLEEAAKQEVANSGMIDEALFPVDTPEWDAEVARLAEELMSNLGRGEVDAAKFKAGFKSLLSVKANLKAEMGDGTYEGYKNYATWGVVSILDNDEGLYNQAVKLGQQQGGLGIEKADAFKAFVEDMVGPSEGAFGGKEALASQLMSAALADVDWKEVADHFTEKAGEQGGAPAAAPGGDAALPGHEVVEHEGLKLDVPTDETRTALEDAADEGIAKDKKKAGEKKPAAKPADKPKDEKKDKPKDEAKPKKDEKKDDKK